MCGIDVLVAISEIISQFSVQFLGQSCAPRHDGRQHYCIEPFSKKPCQTCLSPFLGERKNYFSNWIIIPLISHVWSYLCTRLKCHSPPLHTLWCVTVKTWCFVLFLIHENTRKLSNYFRHQLIFFLKEK